MHPHQRVHTLHVLGSSGGIISVKVGVSRAIDSLLAVNHLAEVGRQLFVSRVTTSPEGIPSYCRNGIVVKMGDPCRLALMDQVRMPAGSAPGVAEAGFAFCSLQFWPNDRYTWNTRDLGCLRLELISLEILATKGGRAHMHFDLSVPLT